MIRIGLSGYSPAMAVVIVNAAQTKARNFGDCSFPLPTICAPIMRAYAKDSRLACLIVIYLSPTASSMI
jgi:hypothetical protein